MQHAGLSNRTRCAYAGCLASACQDTGTQKSRQSQVQASASSFVILVPLSKEGSDPTGGVSQPRMKAFETRAETRLQGPHFTGAARTSWREGCGPDIK